MRKMIVIFALLALFVPAIPAVAVEMDSRKLPLIVTEIVRNRDFFARRSALRGYENFSLIDVRRINRDRVGVCLIEPLGFENRLVYDIQTMGVIYREILLSAKERREAMMRKGVSMSDVVKLAVRAVNYGKKTW